jgi:hypothetical protein
MPYSQYNLYFFFANISNTLFLKNKANPFLFAGFRRGTASRESRRPAETPLQGPDRKSLFTEKPFSGTGVPVHPECFLTTHRW